MGERIDLTIDSGFAACALQVAVASSVGMQELKRTPQEYTAANAEKIRELGFETPTFKFQNGDVENLKFSVMDELHKPLVAACKVVAAGNRIVLQPENKGGSCIEDVRSKRRKRIFERNGVSRAPVLGRQTGLTEAVGAFGRVVPKRPAGLPVSPVTNSETNMDASVEESGHVRVEEFGPTSVDEDVVQEAEVLKHVLAPVLPFKSELESHNVSHLPFRSWCSACVRGQGLSLGHRKVDVKTKEAEQIPTVSVNYGFFG